MIRKKGQIAWNKGTHNSGMKGKHHSEETKKKISLKSRGRKHSIETKQRISISHKGKPPWNKGRVGVQLAWNKNKRLSIEHREHLKLAKIGKVREQSNNWQGGLSFEPYTIDWNESLKRTIRERDRYTCKLCGELQSTRVFCVHHIDYKKENCNPNNLITLCLRCHSKTNNNRKYWIEFFKKQMGYENGIE